MKSPALSVPLRRFASEAVWIAGLGCLIAPGLAAAQLSASEAAAFYQAFLVEPPRTCADLRAYEGKVPTVAAELCQGAEGSAPANLAQHLRERISTQKEWQPRRRGLINGGGVSMGSYQAGRMQGLINDARVEALQKVFGAAVLATDPGELAKVDAQLNAVLVGTQWANLGFDQVAGASAGGMNAVGFAVELCRNTLLPTFAPASVGSSFLDKGDSVLRRMWLDVGFEKSDSSSWAGGAPLLRDTELPEGAPSADRNAVFSAVPLENVILSVKQFFGPSPPAAMRAGCGLGVSITVTSLSPVEVALRNGQGGSFLSVTVPVMVDLRMSSTPPHHLEVHPYTPRDESVMSVEDGSSSALLALVRATGALPPALPMVTLCEAENTGSIAFGGTRYKVSACPPSNAQPQRARGTAKAVQELSLIDGGLFNNNPLDLVLDRSSDRGIAEFLFFDQDFTDIPRPTSRAKYKGDTLYVQFQRLLSAAIVDVARNQQVASALRRFPWAAGGGSADKPQVVSIGRQSPALSEAGFATSAFLLREFRELDYLAGILDAQSPTGQTWISEHEDIKLLHGFYDKPLSNTLDDAALVNLVKACLPKRSILAPGQQAWGRRCLLAAAARRAVQTVKVECRKDPTSSECEEASEFSALGKAAKALQEQDESFQFVSAIRSDIQQQLELLSDRIDETVKNQRSFLAVPSRALDIGMEVLFIDGLQFLPKVYSDEKDLRVIRGRWNPQFGGLLTDLRFVVNRPFWAVEGSRRFTPRLAGAREMLGWEWGIGFVPAVSVGLGLGCSNDGHLTWFRCNARAELLEDGGFRVTTSSHFAMAYGDLSAELAVLKNPVVSFHLGALATGRSGYVFGSESSMGFGLEAGGFLRVGLVRTITLDLRFVSVLSFLRKGANIAKPAGTGDFIFAAGWQY